jgi:hypothetical protein
VSRLRFVALCLITGVVSTYAIAWSCALWSRTIFDVEYDSYRNDDARVIGVTAEVLGITHHERDSRINDVGERESRLAWLRGTRLYGVPLRALRSTVQPVLVGPPDPSGYQPCAHAFELPISTLLHRGIPTHPANGAFGISQRDRLAIVPVWPGFLINTLLAASLIAATWHAVRYIRVRRRVTRGQCPACAYQLADLTTCPECGCEHRTQAT